MVHVCASMAILLFVGMEVKLLHFQFGKMVQRLETK